MTKIEPDTRLPCPYCATTVRFVRPNMGLSEHNAVANGDRHRLTSHHALCPQCDNVTVTISTQALNTETGAMESEDTELVWPKYTGCPPVSERVPAGLVADYKEAALVLPISPKASAALSRRCLQAVLSEAAKTKSDNLSKQIDEVMPNLPSWIADNLDAVRHIGNFAAHPTKARDTGVILDIEPGEAEWNLDVLDALFDHYYVRPGIELEKRAALNEKLKAAGKNPLP
jgi:hypothetical protein